MFFRFVAGLALVVLISLFGAALDKESLALRRRVSQQQFQLDALLDQQARLRSEAQSRGTPTRWLEDLENGRLPVARLPQPLRPRLAQTPLLNWTVRRDAPTSVPE